MMFEQNIESCLLYEEKNVESLRKFLSFFFRKMFFSKTNFWDRYFKTKGLPLFCHSTVTISAYRIYLKKKTEKKMFFSYKICWCKNNFVKVSLSTHLQTCITFVFRREKIFHIRTKKYLHSNISTFLFPGFEFFTMK